MFLIGIYPIIKGNWTEELQYWSKDPIAPGSIIKAQLKTKVISGLVFKCLPIQEAKGEIKEADFKTRKIEDPSPIHIVRPEYVQAVLKTSTYFVQNVGAMLRTAIPACAFDEANQNEESKKAIEEAGAERIHSTEATDKRTDIVAISTNTEDRYSSYKSMIREDLARKKSVLLITPTTRTAEILYESIKKGIEHMTVMIHGSMSKKKIQEAWQHAINQGRNVVIIATPQYVSIPRHDIETIIVDNESSRAYRTFHAPYFDWRKLIENYSKELRAKLVYGDQLLSFETVHRVQNLEIDEIFPLSYRVQQEAELILVDMVEAKQKAGEFKLLSEELTSMIEYADKKKSNIFIFASRRGLSPQTICSDCNTTVKCKNCQAPVVLHKSGKGERYFLCHHCGKERTALEACIKCQSWNLTTLGIGSDTVFEEIHRLYPHMPIFKIDKDSAKTEKEAQKIAKQFYATPGSILVGTETALSYLDTVKMVAIASMDNLFSIPDFRINERIAHICLRLFEIAESYILIQTRNAETPLLKAIASKTLADFVKEELSLREMLSYSPFTLTGKISLIGEITEVTKQAKKIESMLTGYDPLIFPAMIPSRKGTSIHILFTLPKEIWESEQRIHHDLFSKLLLVSKIVPVHINPESFI